MADTPDISVVLVMQDDEQSLPVILAHLEQQSLPASRFEIIIVDNGSRDGSISLAERFAQGAPVRTLCLHRTVPNYAAARNMGVEAATAPCLLFLDIDLLAGPDLLMRHLNAQRDYEGACIIGAISEHPQADHTMLTRWFMPEERRSFPPDALLPFLDWRFHNASMPRQAVVDAGGFDEGFSLGFFEDRDLAWRLLAKGLRGHYLPAAAAYIWRGSSVTAERRRFFFKGYSLYRLARQTNPREVLERYRLRRSTLLRLYESLLIPYYARNRAHDETDIRVHGRFYRHVLQHELARGYEAACRGKNP